MKFIIAIQGPLCIVFTLIPNNVAVLAQQAYVRTYIKGVYYRGVEVFFFLIIINIVEHELM